MNKNYVITIARGFGSGGKDIGMRLSKELGIPCYDRELLTMASKFSGIDESVFVEVDEKLSGRKVVNLISSMIKNDTPLIEPHEKAFISDINLFNIQALIIKELAKTQSCIIIGKCADYILKDLKNVVSIYIEAPRAACVESIVNKMYVSEERAHQLIRRTDRYRANYYKYYTNGNDWTNPINYDMTLNSYRIGREKCVELIKDYVAMKMV